MIEFLDESLPRPDVNGNVNDESVSFVILSVKMFANLLPGIWHQHN